MAKAARLLFAMHETHERAHGLLAQQIGNIQAFDNFGHSGKPQFLPDARGQVLPGSLLPGLFPDKVIQVVEANRSSEAVGYALRYASNFRYWHGKHVEGFT